MSPFCRKPKPNPELVAQQVAQQLPPPAKREKPTTVRRPERVEPSTETDTSQDSHRSDTTDHGEPKKRSVKRVLGCLYAVLISDDNVLFRYSVFHTCTTLM